MSRLPVSPSSLFTFKVVKLYRVHLPLILLPAGTGCSLIWSGHLTEYLMAVAVTVAVLVWGLAASVWAHMLAGRSLLGGANALKGYLVQGLGPPETAFLYYSPAMALAGALTVGLFTDLGLRSAIENGLWKPLYVLSAIFSVGSVACLIHARLIFVKHQHQIAPRFRDAEVLPPWREGELPRTYLGQGLGALLPVQFKPIWYRLIVQYRRRFRIAIALQIVSAIALGTYILNTTDTLGGIERISMVALTLGILVLLPSFRACNGQLGKSFDYRALPISRNKVIACHWLLALLEWIPLLAVALTAALLASYGTDTLVMMALILGGFIVANIVAIPTALLSAPRTSMMAMGVKSVLILCLSVAAALAGLGGA
ncbi:MAG TPA: hypothetical protein EYN66_06200 [Myxococcales bacterium]|nr:hypothetical protein [Myxococcales bacterium]